MALSLMASVLKCRIPACVGLIGLWCFFVIFQLIKAYHTPIWLDDAVFGQVAKSIALGQGYAMAYFDQLVPFSTGISSGPVVILPAAMMIKLVGNTYWAPGLSNVILINILLLITFVQMRALLGNTSAFWGCCILFLFSAMLITNQNLYLSQQMHVWHALMGEVPSALCIIIAVLYLCRNLDHPCQLFFGGIVAGLGVLCKLQVLLSAGIIGLCLMAYLIRRYCTKRQTLGHTILSIVLYGAGVCLPLLVFELAKVLILGWTLYTENITQMHSSVHEANGFSNGLTIAEKMVLLGQYTGIIHAPLGGFLLYAAFFCIMTLGLLRAGYVGAKHTLISSDAKVWARGTLLLCSVMQLFWWIGICGWIMPRYAVQALLYGCAAFALYGASVRSRTWLLLFASLFVLRYDAILYIWQGIVAPHVPHEQEEVLRRMLDIKHNAPGTVFFSCGYTFEIEYLLPGSANIVQCERLEDPAFHNRPKALLSFYADGGSNLLYYKNSSLIPESRGNLPIAVMHCPINDLYAGRNYFIASCND